MTVADSGAGGAHLRADAQRNLERILPAACEVFAEQGLDASVAEIARRADVGNATIFRRFPTKDALIVAVVEEQLRNEIAAARAAAAHTDPLVALRELLLAVLTAKMRDRGGAGALRCMGDPRLQPLQEQAGMIMSEILVRGQHAGVIRQDVVCQDIAFMLGAIASNSPAFERAAPGSWRRYVHLLIDALRPGAAALEPAAPSWDQLRNAWTAQPGACSRDPGDGAPA